MDAPALKQKQKQRRKKKSRSRTQVSDSSDSESSSPAAAQGNATKSSTTTSSAAMTPAQISTAFTHLYTRQAAQEFAEDLDRVRRAEDFGAGAVPLLIAALQQGASLFSADEQRRLVLAEREDEGEKKKAVAGE